MRISDWSSDVCSSDLIADDGAVELAGIDSILRAGAVEQVVLDFRFGDRTKDIKQRFSRRAPSDRPVETIFIDAAEVAEQRRIRSEEHTSELQSLMRISYAVFCLKKKKQHKHRMHTTTKCRHT